MLLQNNTDSCKDYHIQMTEELKEDVNNMCNYSDAILRMGKEEGESLLATLITKLKEL